MKILVTGASKNIGSYVVKELLKMGENLVVAGTNINKLKDMFSNETASSWKARGFVSFYRCNEIK